MVTLVVELKPQKAEHLHRYVHIPPHPPCLPIAAVSHLAHSGGLGCAGLGRRLVPQMCGRGWMPEPGGRCSQPALGGYDSPLRYSWRRWGAML